MVPRQLLHGSWENQANHFIAQCLSNHDHLTILPTRRRHELLQIATNQHPEIHIPRRLLLRQLRRQIATSGLRPLSRGQLWETVNSSATEGPVFQELVYAPRNDNISVCLMGRKEYGSATPFISSLEATYLDEDETDINHSVYGMMRNGTAYHLVARLNFGGHDQIIEPWSGMADVCEERLNRYWTPQPMPGYTNLTFAAISCSGTAYDNRPPNSVINTAISPTSDSQSIYVPVNFPTTTPQSAYIVLYFYQNSIIDGPPENLNATRNMDVYIDGVMRRNVKLEGFRSGEVVTLYPVLVQGTMNVTISPAKGTVLPPLLNGLEVYYATELAEEASTSNGVFKISCSVIMVGVCQLIVSVFLGLI
ncbi:UNVERIFIED_CONTAM: hypothetical protein Sangu_2321200 [Sesamum angustifolium]|uniref:Malectin-like domain-containing protein n=1 Tax=Sesamum angustifolium TaxID=2727405 RepID=A0AAW2L9H3_9LAMI